MKWTHHCMPCFGFCTSHKWEPLIWNSEWQLLVDCAFLESWFSVQKIGSVCVECVYPSLFIHFQMPTSKSRATHLCLLFHIHLIASDIRHFFLCFPVKYNARPKDNDHRSSAVVKNQRPLQKIQIHCQLLTSFLLDPQKSLSSHRLICNEYLIL